jgi:hypothetical protein
MKYIYWLIGVLSSLLLGIYILLFTSFGNSIVKPIIEDEILQQTKLDSNLQKFYLSLDNFEMLVDLNDNNTILVKGEYSIFSQSFNIKYFIDFKELSTLQPLTKTRLQGALSTNGSAVGDMNLFVIDGKSDIARSRSAYHIEVTDLNPTSIVAKITNANLEALLFMLNQKAYANADINLDVNFKNIKPHQLDGDILLTTRNGKINSDVINECCNISIPHTVFKMNLDAKLQGEHINYSYMFNSNLAKISSSGKLIPEPLNVDMKYALNIKELAILKPITNLDIRGSLNLNGNLKGTKDKMLLSAYSDIASSDTTLVAILENFAPRSIKAKIKNLKLQDMLYMLKQPHYADALFSLDLDINDASSDRLKGVIKSKITNGLLDSNYITKLYEFKSIMPRTFFNATVITTINKNIIDTNLDFNSNLVNLDVKDARFDMKDDSFSSEYLVKVSNLDRFYFITQRDLKGAISVNGNIKKEANLDVIMHSNIAGGRVNAKLHNDDFHADLVSLQTLDVLDMLRYPKVFKSSVNGELDYNIEKGKGTFKAKLIDGRFAKNQVLDLVKKYAKTDMYVEIFKGDVSAKINQEHISATLYLKSNKSSIKTKDAKLNSKTKEIDSKIEIDANSNPILITLKGNINSPKVGINAQKLIEKEAKKVIEKEVNKFLKGLF